MVIAATPASASPKGRLNPPEAWEPLLERGIELQERARGNNSPAGLVNKYKRDADRGRSGSEGVRDWYLYARSVGLYFGHATLEAAKAKDLTRKSTFQREAGDAYRDAMQAYNETLRRAPNCYYAYHDMGVLALQREGADRAQAVNWLLQATRIHTRYPDPYRKLTLVYNQTEQWDAVVTSLRRLLAIEPGDLVARSELAGAYARLKRFPEARREAEELQRLQAENPAWKLLAAQIDLERGKVDEAQKAFKSLTREFPAHPGPVQGYLKCLEWKRTNNRPMELEEFRWGLSQLLRFERDEGRREQLRKQLQQIKNQIGRKAMPGGSTGEAKPPSQEQLAEVLARGDEEQRWKVISFLHAIEERPPGVLLKAVLGRLGHTRETSERVRTKAVDIAGRVMGYAWIAVLRLIPEQDPAPAVRLEALDALVRVAGAHATGRAAGILVLDKFLGDDDRALAAAARIGILRLADGRIDVGTNATDAAHRQAFAAWWNGTDGRIARIEALGEVHKLRDPRVEDLLLPSLAHRDFFVRRAAYQAFSSVLELIDTPSGGAWYRGKRANFDSYVAWLRARPAAGAEGYTEASEAAIRSALDAWVRRRP